jgi:hypothetical protein
MFQLKAIVFFGLAVLLTLLVGCSNAQQIKAQHTPPQWTEAFAMPSLLAEGMEVTTLQDIQALLSRQWYDAIDIRHATNTKLTSLDNCSTYFQNKTPHLRALRDNEQSAFAEVQMACEATRLIANADVSTRSFLPNPILSKTTPQQLPKTIALVTSQTEREKLMANSSKQVWGDINTITRIEKVSDYQMRYISQAGVQTLAEIGRGDINQDGIEDVLILCRDSIAGGSYSNFRLFVFSVNQNGEWNLLEHY